MISFNHLGRYGRLGNQMFQYASLKGIAVQNDLDFCIPPSVDLNEYEDHRLFKAFEMQGVNVGYGYGPVFQERFFHFDADLFLSCPDNIDLHGYFQSYKYFEDVAEEVAKDFAFKDWERHRDPIDGVAIHVRRGDYVNQPQNHPVCSEEYYRNAMDRFPGEEFIVFSDDIKWCMEQEVFRKCVFMQGDDNIHEMFLMSECKHNIIANSSFSWWAAWLNPNTEKQVICPENWFGQNYGHYNMADLRPKEWVQL